METFIAVVLWGHIGVAFAGIATFWVPVFTRKGGPAHRFAGKVFAVCAYLVNGSALIVTTLRTGQLLTDRTSAAADPEGVGLTIFLGYLAIVTLACVRHAVRVVATRDDREALRTPGLTLLAVAATLGSPTIAVVALLFWSRLSILFLLLSPVGILIGLYILRTMARSAAHSREWLVGHMTAMLVAGVAFHTAFAVFGLGRLFGLAPAGTWWFLPWVLPAVIGVPAIILWSRAFRRRFMSGESEDAGGLPG